MKRTILFLEQQSWRGGAQRVLESVLEALASEYKPIVAFPNDGEFRETLAQRGIETILYPLGSYRPGRKSFWEKIEFALRTILCTFKLGYWIVRSNVRMVYINGPRCLPAGVMAASLTGRPVLFHLHNILTRRADITLVSLFARFTSTVVACSNAVADSLLQACPTLESKTKVVYNTISRLPAQKPSTPASSRFPFTFGVVGRITEGKGQHILIEAVSKLPAEWGKTCRLMFVGAPGNESQKDNAYLTRLREKARVLGLEAQISWAGYQADVSPFYDQMNVLVFPSIGTEGLPLVILEAMQRGIPVIATSTGGTAEIVEPGKNGLRISAGNADELAGALQAVISDPAFLAKLSSGARATIDSRFSPELFSMAVKSFALELCPPLRIARVIRKRAEIGK